MENSPNKINVFNDKELMSITKFTNDYNNLLAFREKYLPQRLRKKSRQISSKSIKATIKYEYTISKNNSKKENQAKNEQDLRQFSFSTGTILRTQSRILNNKKDDISMNKSEYTYRNKGFENFNMDKVCGSSYRKHIKKDNNCNNNIRPINKNDLKEYKVIKEYTINYDNTLFNENEYKMKLKEENEKNNNNKNINQYINQEKKFLLSKGDYYTDKNKHSTKNNLKEDKKVNNEINFIPKKESEIKLKKRLINEKHNRLKYLIAQKENIPFNIKQKLFNLKENSGYIPKNRNNSNLSLQKSYFNSKTNKRPEENNKTMHQIGLNKKIDFNFLNQLNSPNNRRNTKNKNIFNLYNKFTNQLKKGKFDNNSYLKNRTINSFNIYGKFGDEKCIMPPNNLKNIIMQKEKDYFDLP